MLRSMIKNKELNIDILRLLVEICVLMIVIRVLERVKRYSVEMLNYLKECLIIIN